MLRRLNSGCSRLSDPEQLAHIVRLHWQTTLPDGPPPSGSEARIMARFNRKSLRTSRSSRLSRAIADVPSLSVAEKLEGRLLFSTYVVTSNADSGLGTLRDAMVQANANPGADTIQFSLDSTQTTIALTSE